MLIGASIYYVQINCGNQAMMQRFLSVPTVKDAKHCLIFYSCGIICIYLMTLYNGLLIFAKYHDCDPLTTGLSKASDQLVPLLVMDVLGGVFPGLAGCFVAGVFSAALSSLSTGLNSMAAVILEDFVKPNRSVPLTEKQTALVCKSVVIIVGILCIGLVFVVEKLGMIYFCCDSIKLNCLLFQYFERRFNSSLRLFGSVMYVVGEAVWFPIALYVPALTFNQVTGIGVHTITPIVCGIVTFYTCVGGLKAVVWTDVVQSGLMYGSILLVMIKGTY
uniref:Sodium/solute symporter n=1 Tax=Megaselia scalaris TaxID=36166 RepID=T1H361_MEGSC